MRDRSLNRAAALMLAALAALAQVGCSKGKAEKQAQAAARITVTSPQKRDVAVRTHAVGRLAQSRFATLGAEIPGRVTAVTVEAGDAVRKGQVLVRIDDRDARTAAVRAASRLESLRAQVAAQEKMVRRYRRLLAERFVTQAQLDEAEARLTTLQKSLRAAQADLARAKRNIARTRVRAPFDGRVERRFVAPGDFIGLGKPLVSLSAGRGGAAGLHAVLPFPETMLGRIRPGLAVRLRTMAGCAPLQARISEVSPRVSARNGAFEARVDLPSALDAACWRAGAAVAADVTLAVHRDAWVLPEAAVVLRPAGSVVYVIEGEDGGRARSRRVQTGERLDGEVEIVAGLRGGERIALDGAAWLSDGAPVSVVPAETAGEAAE